MNEKYLEQFLNELDLLNVKNTDEGNEKSFEEKAHLFMLLSLISKKLTDLSKEIQPDLLKEKKSFYSLDLKNKLLYSAPLSETVIDNKGIFDYLIEQKMFDDILDNFKISLKGIDNISKPEAIDTIKEKYTEIKPNAGKDSIKMRSLTKKDIKLLESGQTIEADIIEE